MPITENVIITAALTGAGDTVGRSPHVPVTPEQIAASAVEAAEAGAAVVHIHVRDPQTGAPSRDRKLYREVLERIKETGTRRRHQPDRRDGRRPGARRRPAAGEGRAGRYGPGGRPDRLPHVEDLLPDICTLDCGSLNFGDQLYISTTEMLRKGARRIQELGVKPELEIFDTGQLWFAKQLLEEGLLDQPTLFQLCMGIPWGAPADPGVLQSMVNFLPPNAQWASFALGRMQMPWGSRSRSCSAGTCGSGWRTTST